MPFLFDDDWIHDYSVEVGLPPRQRILSSIEFLKWFTNNEQYGDVHIPTLKEYLFALVSICGTLEEYGTHSILGAFQIFFEENETTEHYDMAFIVHDVPIEGSDYDELFHKNQRMS